MAARILCLNKYSRGRYLQSLEHTHAQTRCICVDMFLMHMHCCDMINTLILQINEVRQLIGPQSGKLALYCSDASISRYLRAQNWNVKKAAKMLKATLKWRLEYKPEEIRWVIPCVLFAATF